ncbi:hydrolase [Clostridium novyi A str. 4570]|uniref:Hydrolase n=1 Tax=Clostridium novyi A str. 4570 TaxID=1444290 RepID=A0AA88ZRZ1_CLONO|nr:MBL fold metallo-hydrolase [Clostridium novyi]KGN02128.1 hydrolase [Clostridium novyi A str. 4570]
MELNKIKGNTYFIDGPTNIGVYAFKNKFCILIDSGLDNSAARKIDDILKENKLHPKYIINTHSHIDHCGGNNYFKDTYTGTLTYTSEKEKLYLENPKLFPTVLFSASPIKKLFDNKKTIVVDEVLNYGTNKINDEKFEIISLKGHSEEHIGIITPEKVCFLGDSLFSYETLEKYSFPFLFNIEDALNTLNTIKELDADFFVLGHGTKMLTKDEIVPLVDANIENIQKYIDSILEIVDQPSTIEDILENILILNDISVGLRNYFLNLSSTSAFVSYLYNEGLIDLSVENGKLY